MSEWYRIGRRIYQKESASLVATAERPEWSREIAALPDLLAALEESLDLIEGKTPDIAKRQVIAMARAAIAKAKGE